MKAKTRFILDMNAIEFLVFREILEDTISSFRNIEELTSQQDEHFQTLLQIQEDIEQQLT